MDESPSSPPKKIFSISYKHSKFSQEKKKNIVYINSKKQNYHNFSKTFPTKLRIQGTE